MDKLNKRVINFFIFPEPIKNWHIFVSLLIINLALSWLFQEHVMTREIYHSLLSDRLEAYRIDRQFELINRFKIWGYLILPLILWFKFALVAFLLQLPLLFKFIEIPFKPIFRLVMIASSSVVLLSVTRIIFLTSIQTDQITGSVLKTTPFSLSQLIDISKYPDSVITMLSTFNFFEITWLGLIFFGFAAIAKDKLKSIDIALLVTEVWIFILVVKCAFVVYLEKAFR